jgi:kumamolisin
LAAAKVEIAGSYRPEPEDADAIGNVDAADRITLTLHLKSRSAAEPEPGSAADLARLSRPTTRRALAAERARAYALIAARIGRFADAHGLTVGEIDLPGRRIVLQGGAQRVAETFDASMRLYDDGRRRFRARVGTLSVPAEIAPWTRAVLGFDERPQVRRVQSSAGDGEGAGLFPTEIAALYGIPLNRDVSAQCVGIIALGGGHLASDLQMALGMMQQPTPTVVDQSVGGAVNTFGGGTAADQEIALDLQVAASLLPQARIVVYFAGNTTRTLADALHQAVLDDVNKPQVLSISWGSAEKFWTNSAREAVQAALADAVRLQVSIVVASGDDLATGGSTDGKAHVWFPASSPYVLGCGGTAATLAGAVIATETVWNDGVSGTGGGISDTFPVPAYQTGVALPASVNDGGKRRGVPDVAGMAARIPGYRIIVGGKPMVKDGTSAATPLWAALIAMANAQRGAPMGLINPFVYANPALFRSVTEGNNRIDGVGYDAGPGWNACTGLGVPKGGEIIAAAEAIPVA